MLTNVYLLLEDRVRRLYDGERDRGASAVEYGLLIGAIVVGIIAAVFTLGDSVAAWFTGANTAITNNP